MHQLKRLSLALAAVAALWALVPALGLAGKPVFREHVNFTSEPYADNLCGVDVTAVDRVVATHRENGGGAFIESANVTTTFTAANGKSVEFHQAGVTKGSAPLDNGDGTCHACLQDQRCRAGDHDRKRASTDAKRRHGNPLGHARRGNRRFHLLRSPA